MTVTLRLGLPETLRAEAAALYWQAFGGKLGRVMGPDARALIYLTRVILADQAIVALDGRGQLLGLAGFKTPQGSFAGGTTRELRAVAGRAGMLWRLPLLSLREISISRHNVSFSMEMPFSCISASKSKPSFAMNSAKTSRICASVTSFFRGRKPVIMQS